MGLISSKIDSFVQKKLNGNTHKFNFVDIDLPEKLQTKKKVAVIGAGLAGLTSALILAERGFSITVFEKEKYIGGKVGSWPVQFNSDFKTNVEHGFHAFFKQYYNLRNVLEKIGAAKNLIPIDDYLILTKDKQHYSFKDIDKAPINNILSMRKTGIYSFKDAVTNLKFSNLLELLKYDEAYTFEKFDKISFKDFADNINLPLQMRLMFTTFSRAFFAEPKHISMAELIKSFHFYFLSNDLGLLYDVLDDDFEESLWKPFQDYVSMFDVRIKTSSGIDKIILNENIFTVEGESFDYLLLATDVKGTKSIIQNSDIIKATHPEFYNNLLQQKQSQRYAVLRIWTDKKLANDVPFFIFTDAIKILDSITFYHNMEKTSSDWSKKTGGGIYELHSYALPDDFPGIEIKEQLLKEFYEYFPEIKRARILFDNLQVRDDFTAFHTGLYKSRPTFKTEIKNLFLAGDWVKIPVPAMLMEAATTSGMFATNEILRNENLKEEQIHSVTLRGLFAK
jgi:carotenoid phi-ring synthase / carotenoid chi-ring synthase